MQNKYQNQSTTSIFEELTQTQQPLGQEVINQLDLNIMQPNINQVVVIDHDIGSKQKDNGIRQMSIQMIMGSVQQKLPLTRHRSNMMQTQTNTNNNNVITKSKYRKQNQNKQIEANSKLQQSIMPVCLKKICRELLQSEIQYISTLNCLSSELRACVKYLKQKSILQEYNCEELFSSDNQDHNWHNMQKISKKFSQKFSNFLMNGTYNEIFQHLQGIQSLQKYKDEYVKIGNIIKIINYLQQQIKKKLLQVQQKNQEKQNQCKNVYYKQISSGRNTVKKIVESEIVDQQFIDTKFKSTYNIKNKQQQHVTFYKKTIQQQNQWYKYPENYRKCKNAIQIYHKIRNNIFKPLIKLKQFMQLITKYIHTQMHTYDKIIKQYRLAQISPTQPTQYTSTDYQRTLQAVPKVKQMVIKISAVLYKIFNNQFQQMSDHQRQVIQQLSYIYPQLFYDQQQLKQLKSTQNARHSQSATPLIISFNALQIYYMDIPCQVYLINNYLIIIKSTYQGLPSMTASKMKMKKGKQIIKLAIVQIDHTTKVEIVSHNMLYQGHVVYITGGLKSSGVYLQFRAQNLNQEDVKVHKKKCKQYIKKNNINPQQFKCPICSASTEVGIKPTIQDHTIKQLQKSTISSNMHILKTMIQLHRSYSSFTYYSTLHNINVYNCHNISYWRVSVKQKQDQYQKLSQVMMINKQEKKGDVMDRQVITAFQYNYEDQVVPYTRLIAIRIIAVQYRYLNQPNTQQKCYIIQLQISSYDNLALCPSYTNIDYNTRHRCYKPKCRDHHCNNQCLTQTITITEQKFYQLQQFVFKHYSNLTSVRRSKNKQYLDIIRFQQARQLFLSSYLPNQNVLQFQCMIITEFFNTLFKTIYFRNKPQLLLFKLGLSEGMWSILIYGVPRQDQNAYSKFMCKKVKRIDCWCDCQQCLNLPQVQNHEEIYQRLGLRNRCMSRFWRYYNQTCLYPYSKNYSVTYKAKRFLPQKKSKPQQLSSQFLVMTKLQRKIKQVGCPIYMHKLQINYLNQLIFEYDSNIQKKDYHQDKGYEKENSREQFCFKLFDQFNRIKYLKYLAASYSFYNSCQSIYKKQCGVLNTVIGSSKVRSLNVLLYCLPSLNDYYHKLQKPQQKQRENIFKQIAQQLSQINLIQNHGFTQKILINIHKQTTCKHLKYIIAQRLQICEEYINHFMQNFILVLVEKQQIKRSQGLLHSWWKGNKNKSAPEFVINQINVLQDYQKVFSVLDYIKGYQNKYFISIKKNIKIEPLLISLINIKQTKTTLQNKQPQQKLIQSYYKLLELQLAQICYKMNHDELQVDEADTTLMKYIVMLLSYLQAKLEKKRQRYQQKYSYQLDERLLVKTGVISNSIFQLYYGYGLEEENTVKKQELQKRRQIDNMVRLQRRKNLQTLHKAQIQIEQNPLQIINKLIRLLYNKTNYNITIQPILYIKNVQNKQQLINCHIFINQEGIIINNIHTSEQPSSMMKSKFKKSKVLDDDAFIEFDYFDIDVELYASVLTIVVKKTINKDNQTNNLLQKYSLFSSHPYHLYQLIKFYKISAQKTQILDILQKKQKMSKIMQKFQEEDRQKSKNLSIHCRNFMNRSRKGSKRVQEQKVHNKLENQFRRSDINNVPSCLPDRVRSN